MIKSYTSKSSVGKLAAPTTTKSSVSVATRRANKIAQRSVSCFAQADPEQAMRDAEKRWERQVSEGRVRNLSAKEAGELMKEEGWVLLDVRPPNETAKVGVESAVKVPIYFPDESLNPGSLLKQMSAFGMGGWWLGSTHMVANENFLKQVQSKIPMDANVIVACQKGLRSLAACEQLSKAGYNTIAWISGGFDSTRPGDIKTTTEKDIRYAGIGGLSELVGWTEVQQEEQKSGNKFAGVLRVAGVVLVLDLLVFAYEQFQYMMNQ